MENLDDTWNCLRRSLGAVIIQFRRYDVARMDPQMINNDFQLHTNWKAPVKQLATNSLVYSLSGLTYDYQFIWTH